MYQDPIIAAYIALLKAHTGAIKTYFQGEPVRINPTDLPCAIVSKRQTRAGAFTNADDEHGIGMSITVITDVRQDITSNDNAQNVVAGIATLYDIMEGRNADLTLKDTSLLGILRSNPLVDAAHGLRTDLGTLTLIDYGATLRDRSPQEWSIEARVDIVCSFHQAR